MDIENSSLWREVQSVLGGGSKPVHQTWAVRIFAGGDTIIPFKIVSVDIDRDYLNNYTDFILVDVRVPLGTYAKRLYPHLANVEIELKRVNIGETSDAAQLNDAVEVERYTAIMIDTGNPVIENGVGNTTSEEDLNRIEILTVKFQLLNKVLEQIRVIPVGGIRRNMTGEDVVKSVLTQASQLADVDTSRKIKGVRMVPASNQQKRSAVILPHNLEMVNVPHHVHYHCGGLYNSGLGYYLQDDYWHVFPAFDNTRFNEGGTTLTIINLPPRRLPGVERTYRKDGDNLVVLATGDSNFRDVSNTMQLNAGNGVRFADATSLLDSFATVANNKAQAARGRSNTEIITDKRPNGINYTPTAARSINANPYVEYSALAARQGSGINLVWENADHTLLYPGMPVRVMYLDGAEIKELYGVLLGAHLYASLRDVGVTSERFVNNLTLSVFVKPMNKMAPT
jgi:hypothetical protein